MFDTRKRRLKSFRLCVVDASQEQRLDSVARNSPGLKRPTLLEAQIAGCPTGRPASSLKAFDPKMPELFPGGKPSIAIRKLHNSLD